MKPIAVIDTETNWHDQVMSIGIVVANAETFEKIDEKYYIIEPECNVGGMYSYTLILPDCKEAPRTSRKVAMGELVKWLRERGVESVFAYNASFDMNHLSEFSAFEWYDIMRIAAYRQYNHAIPDCAECCKTGRLKRDYGVEPMTRLLSKNSRYAETHNALHDSQDELNIMKMLGHRIEDYEVAKLN